QDLLNEALEAVAKQPLRLHGSGRTDTGVHALGQTAHFDAPEGTNMNPFNWVPALNTKLPPAIRVMSCQEVSVDFHSRFSALGKTYFYDLCTEPVLPPFKAGLAWHQPRLLDADALQTALDLYIGTHDFRAFAAYRGNELPDTDYTRTIHNATLETLPDGYRLRFNGNGFLYKMVRLLTGSAVLASQGKLRLDDLKNYLDQGSELPFGKSPLCAPADGLYLEKVTYSQP
ncbi:MAG: tRNA pseudouridine synthase A, partial [Armatimonadetes bacterium]|nr:tRNA pseudouridine synthase A [Akkermansiaceae bacterium]